MLRIALLVFVVVAGGLLLLARLPDQRQAIPDAEILLHDVELTLYPQADPGAIWTFAAPNVIYDPAARETTLVDLEEGARVEDGELDLRLAATRVTIDAREDLRADRMFASLVESGECLTMLGAEETQVLVDQQAGRFVIPVLLLEGEGFGGENRWERVRTSFDLVAFEAGGAGTTTVNEFETGDDAPSRRTTCDDLFPSS